MQPPYCSSRFTTIRRDTRVVKIGALSLGGHYPIRVQSMTTTPTLDIEATLKQCIQLAEAGCELIRVTAQNVKAAEALEGIRTGLTKAGFGDTPMVADIHFLPSAAMEAAKWVEKVRINPGNYADKKKFAQREYSESQYNEELERLHEAFSPIVLRCKELGRAMRIGTNHGSLSDRIMNRYGDSPLGMAESAMEFLRIAGSHGFHNIVLSMKASNPKVMIQAYRLIVAKMNEEAMNYPLHLGVTEAGDGDDARIKSAIGIGSLLYDGLGDTIRVSLTEDPVYELPVARDLAEKAMALWRESSPRTTPDPIDPYTYKRRTVEPITLGSRTKIGPMDPPAVIARGRDIVDLSHLQAKLGDAKIEGLLLEATFHGGLDQIKQLSQSYRQRVDFIVWQLNAQEAETLPSKPWAGKPKDCILIAPTTEDTQLLRDLLRYVSEHDLVLALEISPETASELAAVLSGAPSERLIFTLDASEPADRIHNLGRYRQLSEVIDALGLTSPLWIRNTRKSNPSAKPYYSDQLLEASILTGALLCDGIGDLVSVETLKDPQQAVTLTYNILQGARTRSTKTEFVACPSCGRTLFDLQTTTQRIRSATGHLKGVTIAVMGCIVNGPGEMADADFGYVGGAPGKINLYVGKECVKFHIPAADAVDALIDLIKEHDKWVEPEPAVTA